jgi:RNA polymerase sigma-70 factor (ECF subfamily)
MIDIADVTPHLPALALYASQWMSRAAAEDVVQEALTRLLAQSTPPMETIRWMYTVVRNLAIDQARSQSRRRHREQQVARRRCEWFEPGHDTLLDARAAEQALSTLPAELREIVVLRIWGGLGFRQIGEITGGSIPTTHHRYTAALRQLRAELEKSCKPQDRSMTR